MQWDKQSKAFTSTCWISSSWSSRKSPMTSRQSPWLEGLRCMSASSKCQVSLIWPYVSNKTTGMTRPKFMGLTLSEGFFKTKQNCEWFNFSVNVPNFVPGKWSGSDYECQSNQWHMYVYTYNDSRSLLLCRLLILLRWPIFRYSISIADAVTCRGILVPEDFSAKPRSNTKVKKASGMQNTPVTIDPEVPNIVLLLKTRDFSPDLARTKMTILQVVSPILPRLSSVSQYLGWIG